MDSSNLDQYKVNPQVGVGKRALKLAKDNWVIVSLLVVIVSIFVYGITTSPRKRLPVDDDSKVIPSTEDGQEPPYWIQGFDKGGHFTNFTVVIIDELARNFQEVDKAKFNLNASERILDRQNWKSLFNYTEQIVKGMKLISLQDDVLKSKLREFENAESDFEQCKSALLHGNALMESDSDELITANRTIAHEEGILEQLRDDLSLFESQRKGEVNKTNIQINQKIKEKQQLDKIFEQTIDKDQYIKELQNQCFSIEQNVEEFKGQIKLQQEMKKASQSKYRQNEELSKELLSELAEITFDIQRLELNLEIDEIVGRVKREEQINNTRQLTSIIQKRIKLINSHRIHSASISDELIKTFESDKNQLKDLNNLQINLIRSFRQQAVSQGGKTLEQLKQEEALKKRVLEEVRQEIDGRDSQSSDFENTIAELEQKIRDGQEEIEQLQIKIKELEQTLGTQGEVNAEKIKEKIQQIEQTVNILKQQRSVEESEYQQKLSEYIDKIQIQKDHIKGVQKQFSKLIANRQILEKGILGDLNKCRSFRYLMNTIQQSAIESQQKASVTKHKLYQIKSQLKEILDFMIPDSEEESPVQVDLTKINEEIQQQNIE